MKTSEFKNIVENAISELISSDTFYDVASRNWIQDKGKEEELYPYLTEMIRCQLKCEVQGIGWGRYHDKGEKADCLCYLNIDNRRVVFSVELKGPSKDNAWVSNGLKEDMDKLKLLKSEGIIEYGLAVGLWLIDIEQKNEDIEKILIINSSRVGVKVEILNT